MSVFRNLSGEKYLYKTPGWWYHVFYFKYFGVSINFHPNRIKQYFLSDLSKRNG